METLLIEIESPGKAREIRDMLLSMSFIKKVSPITKHKQLIIALQEHEDLKAAIVKNKNKAIAKYL
ncbi:MAG: hypothetical protein EAZ15_08325 [Sphingobacteriales bacterium]|nr:MAG: hypothetical protein EAZ15_08325 [Sphingobacteriales bacterium]